MFQLIANARGFATARMDIAILVSYFVVGSAVYRYAEGWHLIDSVYFMMVTSTTVGFGDICPATQIGRAFTIVYALLGISVVFGTLSPFINPVSTAATWNPDHAVIMRC